jgi:hypothetical protein
MDEVKKALLRMSTKDVMIRLLRHSLEDVDFQYEGLTQQEKTLVSPEEFEVLVEELQSW